MRDPMTGEDIIDDPERWINWSEDPMTGRWSSPEAQQADPWTVMFGKVK